MNSLSKIMTQENQELLLHDLSARIPYGIKAQVKINVKYSDAHKPNSETCTGDIWGITTNKPYTAWVYSFITIYPCGPEQNMCSISECKPYLRPLSSMTEEENEVYKKLNLYGFHWDFVDWLNANHFDYRRLIEKGLALEAPKNMYEKEESK